MAIEIKELVVDQVKYPSKAIVSNGKKEYQVKGLHLGQKVQCSFGRKAFCTVLEPSPYEVLEGCVHKNLCGGCSYQGYEYEQTVIEKKRQIVELFSDMSEAEFFLSEKYREVVENIEVLKSPLSLGYRNKMEFSFGDMEKGGEIQLGMHRRGRHHDVVTTDKCQLVHPDFTEILSNVLRFAVDNNIPKYDRKGNNGVLRHLVVRRSHATGEIMVALSVFGDSFQEYTQKFLGMLLPLSEKITGNITSVMLVKNETATDDVIGDAVVIYGNDYITEILHGLEFKISLFSFFQTNTPGAEILLGKALEDINLKSGELLLDLFSGTGTIGQVASKITGAKVLGVEIIEEAVKDANENSKKNGLDCIYRHGDVFKVLEREKIHCNTIVVDPPRQGLMTRTTEKIVNLQAENIVYISCNPVTLKNDLVDFVKNGYNIDSLAMVDMFPYTSAVEMIAKLTKKEV